MSTNDQRLRRLSLNQATTKYATLRDVVDECVRNDIESVGLWRDSVAAVGLVRAAQMVRAAGLRVSSLCRGGFLTASDPEDRIRALDDNRQAIDEAATLEAGSLIMVVGGLPAGSKDLSGARARVADALAELAPYARERQVRLALEALHPMFVADRAVLSTLAQAIDLAESYPVDAVGIVVDTFHVWWDPDVWNQIERAGQLNRIASFQICDFLTPLPSDVLLGRGMLGDGHIDLPPFLRALEAAGWSGDVEVEIFNEDVWRAEVADVVQTAKRRYTDIVAAAFA